MNPKPPLCPHCGSADTMYMGYGHYECRACGFVWEADDKE